MALQRPAFLQTKNDYTAQEVRRILENFRPGVAEGILTETAMKVSQRDAGANLSVDIAAGPITVQGDDAANQGSYWLNNDATANVTITAAHATLPRIDTVIARVYDSTVIGGSDTPAFEVVAGTPTGGATKENLTGVGAVPNGAMPLAYVQVDAADTTITDNQIRDARPRRAGYVANDAAETVTQSTYGDLTTPDVIRNLDVPAGAMLHVNYTAEMKESVAAAGRAAIFLNGVQLKYLAINGSMTQEAQIGVSTADKYSIVSTALSGLVAGRRVSVDHPGQVTTGVVAGLALDVAAVGDAAFYYAGATLMDIGGIVGGMVDSGGGGIIGGPLFIVGLAAGTYDVGVKVKSSSGSITAKNRKLHVRVLDPTQPSF